MDMVVATWEQQQRGAKPQIDRLPANTALRGIGSVSWSAGARRPEEQSAPVGERQIPAVRSACAVLGEITLNLDFRSGQQVLFPQAPPKQRVGSTAFDHPLFHAPISLLDVNVDPRVWIDPFHL